MLKPKGPYGIISGTWRERVCSTNPKWLLRLGRSETLITSAVTSSVKYGRLHPEPKLCWKGKENTTLGIAEDDLFFYLELHNSKRSYLISECSLMANYHRILFLENPLLSLKCLHLSRLCLNLQIYTSLGLVSISLLINFVCSWAQGNKTHPV